MTAGLADALDAVRTIAAAAGVTIDVAQGERAALHPGRTGVLSVASTTSAAGVEVGYVGELLPAVAEASDLPGRVIVAELDLDLVLSLAGEKVVAASLSGFPAATQDVSLVLRADVPAAEVRAALAEGAGELLESLRLVDDYRGQGVPEGHEEPDVRAALPRARPHAHGRRGDRGEARRRRRRSRALRSDAARVGPAAAQIRREPVLSPSAHVPNRERRGPSVGARALAVAG